MHKGGSASTLLSQNRNKGSVNGTIYGNVKVRDWSIYTQEKNTIQIKFRKISLLKSNPKSLCDSVYECTFHNYIQGYYFDWGYSLYFNEMSFQSMDTIKNVYKNEISIETDFSPMETPEYCHRFPKLGGVRADHDAILTTYFLRDTSTNFLKLDYISTDTIIGSFKASYVSSNDDVFFERNSDVDRYLTFDCKKFVAVRDTSY